MGLVSIIVTTYNREHYLEKCLKSILAQSFADFSVIVVSDGYFKNTEILIESLNDNRVKLFSNIHTGLPSVSRNIGLKYVNTSYVCFCDDDDIWHEDKLALQLECIEKSDSDVIFTDVSLINSNDISISNNHSFFIKKYNEFLINSRNGLFFKNFICLSSTLLRADIAKNINFNESVEYRGTEDYLFWMELLINDYNFQFLDIKLVNYRIHNNNLSKNRKHAYLRTLSIFKYLSIKYPIYKSHFMLSYFFYSVKKYYI
jgi:glycosyltransferase involved in cell wall biosynthesis